MKEINLAEFVEMEYKDKNNISLKSKGEWGMIGPVEIAGQLSIFDMDETKIKLYEVLEANGYHCEIRSYYLHNDYLGEVKYFFVRTTDDMIIDMCLSQFSEVFTVYEGFSEIEIQKIYRGRLQ